MIAVSVWALLASRHFERVGIAALAGALSGLALMTKETSVVFLAGIVIVAALRAGRERRHGVLAYALAACVVAGPWYVYHAGALGITFGSIGNAYEDPARSPPQLSLASLSWYGWDLVNQQILAPFALAFVIGVAAALRRLVRRPLSASNVEPRVARRRDLLLRLHDGATPQGPAVHPARARLRRGARHGLDRNTLAPAPARVPLGHGDRNIGGLLRRHLRRDRRCDPNRVARSPADDRPREPADAVRDGGMGAAAAPPAMATSRRCWPLCGQTGCNDAGSPPTASRWTSTSSACG